MTAKLDAKHFFVVLMLIALTALAACGGGGDDDDDLNPNLPTPSITGLSVSVANIGETVEIYGLNFGLTQGSGNASCNGTDFTITEWTDTRLTATVPAAMTSGIVVVKQNSRTSTSGSEAQLFIGTMPEGTPLISAITPNFGYADDEVLVIGRNFGDAPAGSTVSFLPTTATSQVTPIEAEVVTVDQNGTMVPQWTRTSIKVKVPAEVLAAGESSVYVTVNGTQSNTRPFTKLPEEIVGDTMIESIDPATGPAGTMVVITGNGFGFSQSNSTITIGGSSLEVISWDNTEIRALIPAGADSGAIRVVINGSPYESQPFTVGNTPVIQGVTPSLIRIGNSLTIYGDYFGLAPGTGSLRVGSTTVAVDDSNWSDNQIYVPKLPKLVVANPDEIPIIVTADNGNASEPFNVAMTSDISIISTVDPPAGEVGTTEFVFNIIASGGSGEYDYELIPDSTKPTQIIGPEQESVIAYRYSETSGFTTKTFKTQIRVTDRNTGDNNIADGPEVLVVAKGSPVITSMAVQDFNRGTANAPNDLVYDQLTGDYYDFSFKADDIYFTSALSQIKIGTETLSPFVRNFESFMNDGVVEGTNQRGYGYRYGTPAASTTGSSVRIMGLNFGEMTGQIWLNAVLDGNSVTSGTLLTSDNILEWSNDAVVIRMPGAVNGDLSGYIAMQTSDSKFAKSAQPLIASAYITAINPNSWQPGGPDVIQISGFDFNPPQIPGVTGTGIYLFWKAWAEYNDPFDGGTLATRQVLRVMPVPPSNVEGTTIFFPTSELTGDVMIEVTNATRTSAQVVTGTLKDGDYSFWLWTGALVAGSNSQIALSGIFSQSYSFTRGAGAVDTWSISGRVTDSMLPAPNNGIAGLTVSLSGAATQNATTGADGSYTFTNLGDGNYTVTPQPNATYTSFTPSSTPVVVSGADETGIDFAGSSMPGP